MVDIEFDHTKATEKQLVYNEIYPPIIEKQKIIYPCESTVYQLLEQTEKGDPWSYRATKKAHATLFKKKFQPMYLEQLCFAINRAGWSVTKIYSHNTFKQECFKKNFILMKQRSRKNTKILTRKIFVNSWITQIFDMIVTTI